MSVSNFDELKEHIGHKIVCVHYGNPPWKIDDSQPICENVAIECETCNEVLIDFDKDILDEGIHIPVFFSEENGKITIDYEGIEDEFRKQLQDKVAEIKEAYENGNV